MGCVSVVEFLRNCCFGSNGVSVHPAPPQVRWHHGALEFDPHVRAPTSQRCPLRRTPVSRGVFLAFGGVVVRARWPLPRSSTRGRWPAGAHPLVAWQPYGAGLCGAPLRMDGGLTAGRWRMFSPVRCGFVKSTIQPRKLSVIHRLWMRKPLKFKGRWRITQVLSTCGYTGCAQAGAAFPTTYSQSYPQG